MDAVATKDRAARTFGRKTPHLVAPMQKDGLVVPIIINSEGVFVERNARAEVARRLG